MTGPEGNSEFSFPRFSMFPETKSRETLRFKGNKIHCFPRDQSLSDLLDSKTKQKQILFFFAFFFIRFTLIIKQIHINRDNKVNLNSEDVLGFFSYFQKECWMEKGTL